MLIYICMGIFSLPEIKMKLRTKFSVLFVTLAVVPLIVVMSISLVKFGSIQSASSINLERQVALTATEEIEAFIALQFNVLKNIETILPEFFSDKNLQESIQERFLFTNSDFIDITLTDNKGREISRKNRILVIGTSELADRSKSPEFLAARDTGYYLGPIFISEGRPLFTVGKALMDRSGAFRGVIFVVVDARLIQDVVLAVSTVEGRGRAYIVDGNGRVIAHPNISEVLAEKNFSFIPIVKAIVEKNGISETTVAYQNELGEEVLGSFAEIMPVIETRGSAFNTGWFVVAEEQESLALAAVRQINNFSFLTLFIVLIISLLAALLFAKRIVGPIEKLHLASGEFGAGHLNYRLNIKTNDEIEDLASGFNNMAESLNFSIKRLNEDRTLITAERNQLELVLSGITDAVIVVDRNRKIIIFNPAAEGLTGYSALYALGKPIWDIIKVFGAEKPVDVSDYCPVGEDAFEGVVFSKKNLRVVGGGGKETYVNFISGHIKEGTNVNIGCILTLQDVSREHTIERLKTEFVSIAAHQLRTPLSATKWGLGIFLDGSMGKLTAKQLEFLKRVYTNNERMIALVNDLLNVARIEEGKFVYALAMTDMGKLLDSVINQLKEEIKNKIIKIEIRRPKNILPEIFVDAEKIALAIQNIVENAVKYSEKGDEIAVTLKATDQTLEVIVQDTGVGIPRKQQSRVFSKFFRGENVIRMETEGSGLGLFIAKNIIDAHGGKINFSSEEGKGTMISVSLPIKR